MGIVTMDMLLSQDYRVAGATLPSTPRSLYALARKRARQGQFWSSFTGRSRALLSLNQMKTVCTVEAECDGGIRAVPISQIRGSQGRSRYFDRDFNPLYDEARGRWLSIARARQQGKHLPPVVLVQVRESYFVLDGHHRISVARALGQIDIEARVTVWQVAGSVPWETFEQPHYLRRVAGKLLGKGAELWTRAARAIRVSRPAGEAAQGC